MVVSDLMSGCIFVAMFLTQRNKHNGDNNSGFIGSLCILFFDIILALLPLSYDTIPYPGIRLETQILSSQCSKLFLFLHGDCILMDVLIS